MENKESLQQRVPWWGIDLDPARRPAYPKEKTPEHGTGAHWERPEQQLTHVKIHKSVEHPTYTPIFGTSAPPKGLSGLMRNLAYKRWSESQIPHWLMLLAADRVDVVEGIFQDLGRGHIPNLWKEMGLKSEWKYNRKNFLGKIAIGSMVFGGAIAYLVYSKRKRAALGASGGSRLWNDSYYDEHGDRAGIDYPDAKLLV